MNHFFKTFFACLLAMAVGGILLFILGIVLLAGLISVIGTAGSDSPRNLHARTVLQIDLARPIVDKPAENALALFDYNDLRFRNQTTLLEAVRRIELAAQDPCIDGIYLDIPAALPTSLSALYELRQALAAFRESGKFVVSYADAYSQGGYYLASVGDKVYLNPQGGVAWEGLSANVLFYKGLLDKLGIRPELIRHGRFKGAGEPFILDRLSDENRRQLASVTGSAWGYLLREVGRDRQIDADSLQAYADRLAVATPRDAQRLGFVDSLFYRDRMRAELGRLTGRSGDEEEDPRLVSLADYRGSVALRRLGPTSLMGNPLAESEIAVVYASGDIVDAGDRNKQIVGNALAETLGELRRDDDVRAVVLRVDSPGGSALAAEIVWREVYLTGLVKPVVVSMGDYAASGGYYISCGADYILAAPTTLTGSIGVFGLLFNVQEGAEKLLGITADGVRTAPSADLGNPFRAITPAERLYIQNGVDSVYARFIEVVAQGRELPVDTVDALGGGRVWSGLEAVDNRLADAAGTLSDAIRIAAEHAGLSRDEYTVGQYPEPEEATFSAILGSLTAHVAGWFGATPSADLWSAAVLEGDANRLRRLLPEGGIRASVPFQAKWQY